MECRNRAPKKVRALDARLPDYSSVRSCASCDSHRGMQRAEITLRQGARDP
jgi:hypothetical protein